MKTDPRMEEVRKLVSGLVTASMNERTNVLVHQNKVIIAVDKTILYFVDLKNTIPNFGEVIAFNYEALIKDQALNNAGPDHYINDYDTYLIVNAYFTEYINISTNAVLVAQDLDLRSDPEFEKLISLKATEGLKFYKMINNIDGSTIQIPIFSGFPSVNAQDKVSIKVFDIGYSYVIMMTIYKKKFNRDITMSYRIIKFDTVTF